EDLDLLQTTEKQQKKAQFRDHVRFLRLLKSGQCSTQAEAAQQVNLSLRQAQRIWKTYQEKGLETLVQPRKATYFGKLSTIQISHLRQFLLDDQAQTLADIQAYLRGSLGVEYTIGGVFDLCKRLKIKSKTGRPVHIEQAPGAIETFKKSLVS
ncbi:helix-turn-helix domain-containing protein, partial [Spirosoma litoris]